MAASLRLTMAQDATDGLRSQERSQSLQVQETRRITLVLSLKTQPL